MIQIFLKKSKITENDWRAAYQSVEKIVNEFPIPLIRIESFDGFNPKLDKEHYDLYVNKGSAEEYISFYGDSISYTAGRSVRVYKNWGMQLEIGLKGEELNDAKPITWYPPGSFNDNGTIVFANGCALCDLYIDTNEAVYEYALLAIGTMLENFFPGKVLLIASSQSSETMLNIAEWLSRLFYVNFNLPLYFDRNRLLSTFAHEYEEEKHIVERMDNFYQKRLKNNIEFAISHVGYKPSIAYYSEMLSFCKFGTLGFSHVLDSWIAATRDLECTLEIISKSKEILKSKIDDLRSQKEAECYDFSIILKSFLDKYILWDPIQREQLQHFFTNKQELETGEQGLWGAIMQLTGYRIDICPIYATTEVLFEAFMCNDPVNGAVYKNIINEWVKTHRDTYDNVEKKLSEAEYCNNNGEENLIDGDEALQIELKNFLKQFPEQNHFIIKKALGQNSVYVNYDEAVEKMHEQVWEWCHNDNFKDHVNAIKSESNENKIVRIKKRIKELQLSVNPDFEDWMLEERDSNVLFFLRFMLTLKLYDRGQAYIRSEMLLKRHHWLCWRSGQEYDLHL